MYSTWSVIQLKEELRKRNASSSGKKAALIERLEAYDRNDIIGVEEELEDEIPEFPDISKFRDVNASTHLPPLSKNHIQEFAERYQVPPKGRLLYESRSLVTLRIAFAENHAYFHLQCKAQMKKLLYIVLLKIDLNGTIEISHCECAAGSGLEAHCKHIFTALHGIEDMVRTKTIIMHKVCTQELMSFKTPKRVFYDSPMESHVLPGKRPKTKLLYDPINDEEIIDNYEDYVKNLAIGFASTNNSTMPYLQVIKPANPYATECDHDYLKKTPKDLLLESLSLRDINQHRVDNIEACTIGQATSKDWHLARNVRITASNFHAVCHSKQSSRQAMVKNILEPRKFTSRATTHGKVNEPIAIHSYEEFLGEKIRKCGIFISLTHPFLAASPDGLLNDETVIEVKCPFVTRNSCISPTTIPYLYKDNNGNLKLKNKHQYYTQVQGQLFCTNRKYCNFIVYTFKDMKTIYIERDEQFISEMIYKLKSFYEEHLQPAIFEKYLYKYYGSAIKQS